MRINPGSQKKVEKNTVHQDTSWYPAKIDMNYDWVQDEHVSEVVRDVCNYAARKLSNTKYSHHKFMYLLERAVLAAVLEQNDRVIWHASDQMGLNRTTTSMKVLKFQIKKFFWGQD